MVCLRDPIAWVNSVAQKKSRKTAYKSGKYKKTRSWKRRLWPYLVLVLCALLAAFAMYMLHLDRQVRAKFEGTRWKLPAKVYASPQELYAGLDMARPDLVKLLQRQGYREADTLDKQGTYALSGSHLDIHARRFQFWDGTQKARRLRLNFNAMGVSDIKAMDGKGELNLLRLDPLLIGSIYPGEGTDRILVKIDDVPPMLPAGLIAVEDQYFLSNWGVSPRSILRAAIADIKAGQFVQGGSTITQQLVKNFYLNNKRTLGRKIKEALMAILLDAHYSKNEILESYLNEVYMGQDGDRAIHGFGLASYYYFKKPVEELEPREVALLVAMVKGPNYYNPRRNPDQALARRNMVLDRFHAAGLIKDKAWHEAKLSNLGISAEAAHDDSRYPAFIDLVRRQLHGQYKDSDLTDEGLRIFTTLDPRIQSAVDERINKGLDQAERAHGLDSGSLEAAGVVTSVEEGNILALAGGRDRGYAGYNRALKAHRQIGSLMKPISYLAAIEQPSRYNPITPLDDTPLAVKLANGQMWRPHNYARRNHGREVPLYYALENSYNVATSRLALDVGIPNIIKTLKRLGYEGDPTAVPSLALGAVDMTPLEVAQVYNTLATGGYYTPLRAIRDVTTRDGEPLNRYPLKVHQVVDSGPAYIIQWLMQRVASHGTGAGMYRYLDRSNQMAGKTGSTNDLRDAWFAGFGENRVGVIWVGRDDDKSTRLTGATGALPIWAQIMKDIGARGIINSPPDSIEEVPLNAVFNPNVSSKVLGDKAANLYNDDADCPSAIDVPFIKGYVPKDLGACDTDVMSQNRRLHHQRKKDKEDDERSWFEKLF